MGTASAYVVLPHLLLKVAELASRVARVVKGAVLQHQLCHQRLWVRAQTLS